MSAITAVANHLNIAETMISEIQEWASVLWVRFVSGRPRFVSKKVVKTMNPIEQEIESKKITSSFSQVWDYLKANGKRQGAKLNYRVTINGVEYTLKEVDQEWRVSVAAQPKEIPFTGIAKTGEEAELNRD